MQTSNPLLYAPYAPPLYNGPMQKIQLLPVTKLVKLSVMRKKAEFRIQRYLTVYSALFIGIGLSVGLCLTLIHLF